MEFAKYLVEVLWGKIGWLMILRRGCQGMNNKRHEGQAKHKHETSSKMEVQVTKAKIVVGQTKNKAVRSPRDIHPHISLLTSRHTLSACFSTANFRTKRAVQTVGSIFLLKRGVLASCMFPLQRCANRNTKLMHERNKARPETNETTRCTPHFRTTHPHNNVHNIIHRT